MEKQPILILLPGKVHVKSCMRARECRCSLLKRSSVPKMGSKKNILLPFLFQECHSVGDCNESVFYRNLLERCMLRTIPEANPVILWGCWEKRGKEAEVAFQSRND